MSFYLPAFTRVAAKVANGEAKGVSVIALYPRNELLKDQFTDAYKEARKLDSWLQIQGKRKIRIAAIFQSTPTNIDKVPEKWKKSGKHYICPYMPCPTCQESLVWRESDVHARQAILHCSSSRCSTKITEEELILTREQALKTKPDFLFTTTEMLNRYLSNAKYGPLIGVHTEEKPELVLLDEVHTYSGTHRAQVAILLRRWQHAILSISLDFLQP